jgi:hypothetical protein
MTRIGPPHRGHSLRATERRFQVDDPVLSVQWSQPGGKDLRLRKKCEISLEGNVEMGHGNLPVTHTYTSNAGELTSLDGSN